MRKLAEIIVSGLLGLAVATSAIPQATSSAPQGVDKQERSRSYFGDDVLVDQDGVSHRFFSDLLSGRVVLINVIFTNCKDACPMQTQRLQSVRRQLGDHFGSEIFFLSLSVDPKRDNPVVLKQFAVKQNADVPGWRFLVAEEAVMAAVLGRLGQWTNNPTNHGTLLIAGNASQAHWLKLRPDSPPERIAADLLRLSGKN
jgi:cytochrome oxidase Cu insertion factor (SCO1/SenC/PrrC family)